MDKKKRTQYGDDSGAYLDKVSDRYIFDRASGIYKQKSGEDTDNRSTDTAGRFKRFPFWVTVKRDWIAVLLSALSLFLFAITIHYARKQWQAMNDTLGEIRKQTSAIQESADASDRSSLTAQRAERDTAKSAEIQNRFSREQAQDAKDANKMAKDAIEAQLGSSRPVLEVEPLGVEPYDEFNFVPGIGKMFRNDKTTVFQIKFKNTGPREAVNIHYSISQPFQVSTERGILYTRHAIETLFENGDDHFRGVPVMGKVPSITEGLESDPITVKTGNLMPNGGPMMWDYGEAFYGEVDWDDVVGFGHRWRRQFCLLASFNNEGEHLVDCGVKEERVLNRDDLDTKKQH